MGRRGWYVISTFTCQQCGMKMPLPRNHGQQREHGHIKDIYCPGCKKISKFVECKYNEFEVR